MSDSEKKYSVSRPWKERGFRTRLACIIGAAWTVYIILHLFKVFFYAGIIIYPIAHRAICAGAIITLTLLVLPARKKDTLDRLPWYDVLLILGVVAACAYVTVYSPIFVYKWGDATPPVMVLAGIMSLGMLEAIRRSTGLSLVFLIIGGFFYIVYSDYFPGFLMGAGYSYPRAVGWIFLSGEGYWGTILGTVVTTVPGFILFGSLLEATGASEFFANLALGAMGSTRGGPAKTAVLSSMFMGSISGSVAANVATTGQITIPMMIKNGYSRNLAGAVEAVASTGGMFTPPIMGATAFLIADFLNLSYWTVCAAAFLPALLYYGTLLFQVDIEAIKAGSFGLPKDQLPRTREVLRKGWFYLVPFIVLVVLMGGLKYSAETTIVYTLVAMVVCASFSPQGRLSRGKILWILESTARGMISIIPLCTGIGIVVAALTITGAGANLSMELGDLAGQNPYLMLLLAGLASFVLGMGMTAVSCYLLTVTLLAPGIIAGGIDPLAAHMFLFYYGCLSFITPPVAVAAFVAAGISDGSPSITGVKAIRLGISAVLLPWAFVVNPALLWQGSLLNILLAAVATLISLFCLSIGLSQFFCRPLNKVQSLLSCLLGATFFIPSLLAWQPLLAAISAGWMIALYLWNRRRQQAPA